MIHAVARCTMAAALCASSAHAVAVAIQGHIGAGLVETLENAGSESVLEEVQRWGWFHDAPAHVAPHHNSGEMSLIFLNSTRTVMQPSAAGSMSPGMTGTSHHWGFVHENPFAGAPAITAFLHYLSFAALIKLACMLSNVMFQLSPYPMVKKFRTEGGTGEVDGAPLVAIAFSGTQWCFYGIFAWLVTGKSGFLVLFYSNFLGCIFGIYYTFTYHTLCKSPMHMHGISMYYRVAAALVFVQAGAMVMFPRERALFFSGLVSSSCSIAVALSTLASLPTVIRMKDATLIPATIAMISFGSAILWIVCGLLLRDPWIIAPNIVGICCYTLCLSLRWKYGTGPAKQASSCASSSQGGDVQSPKSASSKATSFSKQADAELLPDYGSCGETGGTF